MKKIGKFISLALSLTTIASMGACGPTKVGEDIDKSKTQLYVGLHQAGYGIAWFDAIKAGFEAKNPNAELIRKHRITSRLPQVSILSLTHLDTTS